MSQRQVGPATQADQTREPDVRTPLIPVSVNWHVWPRCNYTCTFCYDQFKGAVRTLTKEVALTIPALLRAAGAEKLTLAGGEPTLCPHLMELLRTSKEAGLTTMVVTNGTRITPEFLAKAAHYTDWIAGSGDSGIEATETELGRGTGHHLETVVNAARLVRAHGIRLKVNTVVTSLSWQEDMHQLLRGMGPERWKVFQVHLIRGENDEAYRRLRISPEEFEAFLRRHADLSPVGETEEDMRGSYLMLDPLGRFFQNFDGAYAYSDSILDVSVAHALGQVGWDEGKFLTRGGLYYWNRPGGE